MESEEAETSMAKRLLLKVFSGPHLGAESVLADGEYTIGRGLHCDLVFEDHAVAEEHLRLKVVGGNVHAQPLGDARMLIGGKPTDGCTLPPGEYFTIGTTHLAVGFTGEQWVLKALPELKLDEDAAPSARPAEPEKTEAEAPPRKSRKKRVAAAVVLAVLLTAGAWGSWAALTPMVQAGVVPPDGTGAALAELIAKHGVGDSVKTQKTERGWIIQGHLQDRASLKALEADCRKHVSASAIRLWDSETLASAAGEVLAAFRLPVAAAPGAPGEVIFVGRVPETAQWSRVRERIRHDVPALMTLTDNVLTGAGRLLRDSRGRSIDAATAPPPPPANSYVVTILPPHKNGPDEKKSAEEKKSAGDVEMRSVAKTDAETADLKKSASEAAAYSTLIVSDAATKPVVGAAASKSNISEAPKQNVMDGSPPPNVMYAAATPLPPVSGSERAAEKKEVAPVLAYQSVSVGATSWLRLADGTRVSLGGRIGSGYEITSISDMAIEARKGDARVVYRLKEGG